MKKAQHTERLRCRRCATKTAHNVCHDGVKVCMICGCVTMPKEKK